jgi:phage terminase small subunit
VNLTPKQARFVAEYLVDLNATQAAIRAGYSAKTAGSYGNENLKKPEIQNAIQEALSKQQERTEITADMVLQELFRLASFDPRKLFHPDGTVKNIHELDDDTAACIGGVETQTDTDGTVTRKVKVWDKNSALEKLGKHFMLFTDRVQHSGEIDVKGLSDDQLEAQIAQLAGKAGLAGLDAGAGPKGNG